MVTWFAVSHLHASLQIGKIIPIKVGLGHIFVSNLTGKEQYSFMWLLTFKLGEHYTSGCIIPLC